MDGVRAYPMRAEERFEYRGVYRSPAGNVALYRLRDGEEGAEGKKREEWRTAIELCESGDALLLACPELGVVEPEQCVPEVAYSAPVSAFGPRPPFCFARAASAETPQRVLILDPSVDATHPHVQWTPTHVLCAGARAFLVAP